MKKFDKEYNAIKYTRGVANLVKQKMVTGISEVTQDPKLHWGLA